MLAAHLRIDRFDFCFRLRGWGSRGQAPDDEITPPIAGFHLLVAKRKWLPNLRTLAELAAVAQIEKLKREIKTRRHHADNGETFAVEKKVLPNDLRIAVEPALPQSSADDHDIVAAKSAFFRLEDSAFDGRNTEQRQHASCNSRAGNSLGSVFAGEIEIRVTECAELFKTVRARFVIFELGWRDGNPFEILRFEMLKQQDEVLMISIRQWPNQQTIHET